MMEERRFGKRWPTALNGRVILIGAPSPIHCTVREISDGGAQISFAQPIELPPKFELEIGKGFLVLARVRWSDGNNYGLAFVRRPVVRS